MIAPDAALFTDGLQQNIDALVAMREFAQDATVTIGDRTLRVRLKAGVDNRLDYAQVTP